MSRIEIADVSQVVAYGDDSAYRAAGATATRVGVGEWTLTLEAPVDPDLQVWMTSVHGSASRVLAINVVDESTVALQMRDISGGALADGSWAVAMLRLPNA